MANVWCPRRWLAVSLLRSYTVSRIHVTASYKMAQTIDRGIEMKDDLTNWITASLAVAGGFPLVIKG